MTLPKKGFRTKTVNDTIYKYKVTGEDEGIRFIIGIPSINGQVLIGYLDYDLYQFEYESTSKEAGFTKMWFSERTIVTPKTIREVILYSLDNNWKPRENLKQMSIRNLLGKINLKKITNFPELKWKEVVVVFESQNKRLKINFTPYNGEGNIYHKFDNITLAQ